MTEARLADGTILRFPDSTPPDVIDRAVQLHVAQAGARQANSGVGGYIDSLGRQFAQGATFGTMDEIAAGLNTGAGLWGNYGETLTQERARDAQFRQENPIASMAANVAGGVLGPGRALGTISPAGWGGGTAARFLRSGAARGVSAGATGGALAGAGEGEGIGGRIGGALTGAATGGALGGLLGAGVSAGASVAGRLGHALGLRNPEVAADRQVLRAMERDGIDPATFNRPQYGPAQPPPVDGTALVDQGGRNVQNLAAVAANTPGQAMEAADRLVQARRGARPDRIATAVDDALGGGGGTRVADEVATLQEARRTQAGPRYAAAFGRITPTADEAARVERFVADPIGQDALQRGLRVIELEHLARNEPFNPGAYGVTRGENGGWVLQDGFRNLRLMDAVKRGFDDIVEGFRDPTSGRLNLDQYGRAVNDARAAYVRDLREMFPRYAGALDAWGGPSRSLDAVGRGRQALTTDPDVVQRIAADLSPSDLEFFRLGVGRAITDSAADPARAATAARRLLEDRNMQRRLEAAIPDPAQRAQFGAALAREVDMANVERTISPRAGSHTERLRAAGEDMATDPPGGWLAALLQGRTAEATKQGLASLYRRTQGINPATADALASRLMNSDAAANAETVQRLLTRRTRDELTAHTRAALAQQLLRGVGVGASLEAND